MYQVVKNGQLTSCTGNGQFFFKLKGGLSGQSINSGPFWFSGFSWHAAMSLDHVLVSAFHDQLTFFQGLLAVAKHQRGHRFPDGTENVVRCNLELLHF